MKLEELEQTFSTLSEITDRVSLMNSPYESDLDSAFRDLEGFIKDLMTYDLEAFGEEELRTYLSHMSFHREIVSDIIDEARSLLMEDRRTYLKLLVNYHKMFIKWFSRIEKKYMS